MKERRTGAIGRATGFAEGMAATMRRMQRDREPRVLLYDSAGRSRLLQPHARGYDDVLELAARMVEFVEDERPRRRRTGRDQEDPAE